MHVIGLTEEEVLENERLWAEENDPTGIPAGDAISDLSSVGVRTVIWIVSTN